MCNQQAADVALHVKHSFEAIREYFSRSPYVLTADQSTGPDDDQCMLLLLEDFMRYAALSGTFMQGAKSLGSPGSAVIVRFVIFNSWDLCG